jgi:GNAT superfamily N-acetyltransferase
MGMKREPAPSIRIAQALPGQESVASAIAREAAQWLIDRGAEMWDQEETAPEVFAPRVQAGEVHLAYVDEEPVGVMVLQWEDPTYWPEVPAGESAFVHRLAVRRRAAGKGVSGALLAHARTLAIRAGRRYLRLDCDGSRLTLCGFYESVGFTRHSLRVLPNGYQMARYGMRVTR